MTTLDNPSENIEAKLQAATQRPWPKWMRNLLAHLIKSHFPTLDAKSTVRLLEAGFRRQESRFLGLLPSLEEFPPRQFARFFGHLCALVDYGRDRVATFSGEKREEFARLVAGQPVLRTHEVLGQFVGDLGFQKRALFLKEFAYAYGQTFAPMGELRGLTDATPIYFRLLKWSAVWLLNRPPKTVAELQAWMLSERPRPKLPPLEEQRRQDREAKELRRLQQICERLGLRFRPPRTGPHK